MTGFFEQASGPLGSTPEHIKNLETSLPQGKAGFTTNLDDRFKEAHLNGLFATGVESLTEFFDSSRLVSPEYAKENYGVTINEPVKENIVSYRAVVEKRRRDHAEMMTAIDAGSAFGIKDPAVLLAAGFTDPANVILFQTGSFIAGAVASSGVLGARVASVASKLANPTTALGKIGAGATIEALETLAIEIPLRVTKANQFGEDYTFGDAATDLGFGIAGGAAFGAARAGFGGLKERFSKTESQAFDNLGKDQTTSNRVPDYKKIDYFGESNKEGPKDTYVYTPIKAANTEGTTFYASFRGDDVVNVDSNIPLGRSYGRGLVLTDSKDFARANASKNIDLSRGKIAEIDLNDPLLYDLTQPVTPEIKQELEKALSPFLDSDEIADTLNSPNTKEILDQIEGVAFAKNSGEIQEAVNQVFKDQGFNGYLYENVSGNNKSNSLFLFDPDNISKMEVSDVPNPKVQGDVPNKRTDNQSLATKSLIDHKLDPKNAIDYDPEFEDIKATPLIIDVETELPKDILDVELEAKEGFDAAGLEDIEVETASSKALKKNADDLKKFEENNIKPEQAPEVGKSLFFCNKQGDD